MKKRIITIAVALAVIGSPSWAQESRITRARTQLDAQVALAPQAVAEAMAYFPDEKVCFECVPSRVSNSNFAEVEAIGLVSEIGMVTARYQFPEKLVQKGGMDKALPWVREQLGLDDSELSLVETTGVRLKGPLSALKKVQDNENNIVVELTEPGFSNKVLRTRAEGSSATAPECIGFTGKCAWPLSPMPTTETPK